MYIQTYKYVSRASVSSAKLDKSIFCEFTLCPREKEEHSLVSDFTTFSLLKKKEHSLVSDFTTFSPVKKK